MRPGMAFSLLVALAAACGDGSSATADDAGGVDPDAALDAHGDVVIAMGRYLPLAVGASWTYRVTDLSTTEVTEKTQAVETFEDVGGRHPGVMAFRLRSEKASGYTLSWQQDTGTAIVRHREQSFDALDVMESEEWYDPSKLRLDEGAESIAADAAFTEDYIETHIDGPTSVETMTGRQNQWTVEAVDELVTVPAGTFSCLHLHRVGSELGQSDKRYWFARGVGKVKESGGKLEELSEYSVPE